MWTRLLPLLFVVCAGCAPRLQVARWQDMAGTYAVTIRCSAYGRTVQAELATDASLTVRPPTPPLEEP